MLLAFLMGNLGKDPEVRFSPSGQKITTFSVASNTKRQGKEETTWFRITIFGDRFDKMISFLKKGSSVIITGELTTQIWTDKEGRSQIQNEMIADTIKFAPSSRSERSQEGYASSPQSYAASQNYSQARPSAPPQPQPFTAPFADFSFETANAHDSHAEHDEPPF